MQANPDVTSPSAAPPPPRAAESIARRIDLAFVAIGIVSIATTVVLLVLTIGVSGLVSDMRDDEAPIRNGLDLALAIREQYVHVAHTVVTRDESRLAPSLPWVERVREDTRELRAQVAPSDRWRVESIEAQSLEVDRVLRAEILPAVRANDEARLRGAHESAERLSTQAALQADTVVRSLEGRMARMHTHATHTTHAAIAVALLGMFALAALSFAFTRRIRAAVLTPLATLTRAARRIGAGELDARVGPTGEGELRVVAEAFDRMASELRAREARVVASERMAAIGQLAAGVAHEINNPIGVIRGYIRTMLPEAAANTELADELRILDDEAAACQRIADDLLAFARTPDVERTPVEMDELLRQTVERFAAGEGATRSRITVEADPARLDVDALRTRQVVVNLLRNAIEASPPDAPVEVHGRASPGGYTIAVVDRGPGISDEVRARIFEPFFSARKGGSGLGLAVCEGIVRMHGGSIEARPRAGGGTEMLVSLPASGAAS